MAPTTVTGSLHPSNRDAIAWNERGLVVFGCHSTLVFFDACRMAVFQTLEQHSTAINLVCWKPSSNLLVHSNIKNGDASSDLFMGCASSDISGNIFVWDVKAGIVIASLRHATTSVNNLNWIHPHDASGNLLLSTHSNSLLILWDIDSKERVWEHKFSLPVYKFCIDPFDQSKAAISSAGSSLVLLEELSSSRWSDPPLITLTLEPRAVSSNLKATESAIVQIKFHAAFPHFLFVLFSNEIFLVETQHRQVIYSAIVDTGSPLTQILPCAERDAFFLVHRNGVVSLRVANFHFSDERISAELDYERKCFVESIHRQSARLGVMGAAICPITSSTVALFINSGRLLIYQLEQGQQKIEPYRLRTISDFLHLDEECQNICGRLRLTQNGLSSPLSSTTTVVRMRPIENGSCLNVGSDSGQLAAVGGSTGIIHLVDVFEGKNIRDLQIHSCQVKCLEWAGPNAIVSAAYIASLSSSNTVRNDIFITDIRTGWKRRLRPEQEESPIEAIRVSHYSSYLAISFRQHPLEIWDLGTQRLLRRMNKRCPIIVDMCWSGKHHQSRVINDRTRIFRENLVVLDNDNHLYHVVVKGLHVRDGKEVSTQWKSGAAFLRCMVWKDDVLAFGDSSGRVGVWVLGDKSQCRQSGLNQSTRGPVLRIVFSKLAGDYTLAAQHPTSLVVWDTERLHVVFVLHRPGLSIIDIDMCGLTPVYISSDGSLRFALYDTGKGSNVPLSESDSPMLVQSSCFGALLENSNDEQQLQTEISKADKNYGSVLIDRMAEFGENKMRRIAFACKFAGCLALASFCEIVESVLLRKGKSDVADEERFVENLPTNLFQFWTKQSFKKRTEFVVRLLLSTYKNERQLEQAIEKCIIMKKNELAMYYLLNNDRTARANSNKDDVRMNAFRACLLSVNFDSEASKCLVKLTATNLIASNYTSDGIQLLSLIDQGLDACKYLVSQGLWEKALVYSKIYPNCEFDEIYARYAEYLVSNWKGKKSLALMIFASLGNWERCNALLVSDLKKEEKKVEQETTMCQRLVKQIIEEALAS